MLKKQNFLIYCGNPGIGKTHFCASLIEFAITNFRTWRYWREADLLKKVRAAMEEYKGDYLDALQYFIDDDLLFLDDVGSTGMTDWREEVLFYVIDSRYNSMKPTVITSNFSRKDFSDNYHPRIFSRLFDKDNFIVEILDGIDLRLN